MNVVLRVLHRLDSSGEEGQGMIEYALILVLISVVTLVVLSTVGREVGNVFSNVSSGLNH